MLSASTPMKLLLHSLTVVVPKRFGTVTVRERNFYNPSKFSLMFRSQLFLSGYARTTICARRSMRLGYVSSIGFSFRLA